MGVRRLAAAFSPSIMPKFARNQLSYECFRANIIFVAAQLAGPHLGNQESIRERSKQARSEAHFQALGTTSPPLRSPPVSFGLLSSNKEPKPTNIGNGEHKKRRAPAFTGAPLFVWGWREIYGFGCACGCVLALCFLLWMFFDAPFCSLLICFFSEAVSVPPLALRSAATCLLMPFC